MSNYVIDFLDKYQKEKRDRIRMKKRVKRVLVWASIVLTIVIITGGIVWKTRDLNNKNRATAVVAPGDTMASNSWIVTNATGRFIHIDFDAMRNVRKENGGGFDCLPFVIEDKRSDLGVVINGKIYINGQDELRMNAGVFAGCYISRFVQNQANEQQLYDANTLGAMQAVRLTAGTYKDFVTLMGGSTYVPEFSINSVSFNTIFLPSPRLPLLFYR